MIKVFGHKLKYKKFLLAMKKKSHNKGEWILKDAVQRCFGVSIFEDGEIPAGHSPEQPAVVELALSKVLDGVLSRGAKLQTRFKWHWIKSLIHTRKKKIWWKVLSLWKTAVLFPYGELHCHACKVFDVNFDSNFITKVIIAPWYIEGF